MPPAIRVLIIDDIDAVRKELRQFLCPPQSAEAMLAQLMGQGVIHVEPEFLIEEAAQGEEGVHKARLACQAGQPFDIALVDMKMPPGISGAEAIRRIRSFDTHCKVIVCTGHTELQAEDLASANAGQCPIVLSKPFENRQRLIDAINTTLGR